MATGNFYYNNILGVISPNYDGPPELYPEEIEFAQDTVLEHLRNEYKDKKTIYVASRDEPYNESYGARNHNGRVFGHVVVQPWDDADVEILLITYSGYYTHANIDYEVKVNNYASVKSDGALIDHPSVQKAVRQVEDAIKKATKEYRTSARFSSGETWYEPKED